MADHPAQPAAVTDEFQCSSVDPEVIEFNRETRDEDRRLTCFIAARDTLDEDAGLSAILLAASQIDEFVRGDGIPHKNLKEVK